MVREDCGGRSTACSVTNCRASPPSLARWDWMLRQSGVRSSRRRGSPTSVLGGRIRCARATASSLKRRTPEVGYSARILFQELGKGHGYNGSYESEIMGRASLRDGTIMKRRVC